MTDKDIKIIYHDNIDKRDMQITIEHIPTGKQVTGHTKDHAYSYMLTKRQLIKKLKRMVMVWA